MRASRANIGRQSPPVRGARSLCSLLRTPHLAMQLNEQNKLVGRVIKYDMQKNWCRACIDEEVKE